MVWVFLECLVICEYCSSVYWDLLFSSLSMLFLFTMICCPWLWAEWWAELAARIGLAFLSQRPIVTAPASFVATPLCPTGVLNQSLWHLTSGLHLPQENVLPLGLEQPNHLLELLIWPLFFSCIQCCLPSFSQGFCSTCNLPVAPHLIFPCSMEADVCTCPWSSQLDAVTKWLLFRVFTFLVTLIWTSSSFSKNTVSEQTEYSNYELISLEYRDGVYFLITTGFKY